METESAKNGEKSGGDAVNGFVVDNEGVVEVTETENVLDRSPDNDPQMTDPQITDPQVNNPQMSELQVRDLEVSFLESLGLPAAHQYPERETLIFDGRCHFCQQQVRRLSKLDLGNRLAFASLHHQLIKSKYADISHDELMQQMYLITPTNDRFAGANAIRYLSRKLFLLWPIAPFLHIPFSLGLWQGMYSWVAKRRYKISQRMKGVEDCSEGACKIHFDK